MLISSAVTFPIFKRIAPTNAGIASLSKENALTLERFDTNDFPKVANAKANILTRKAVN